MEFTGERFIPQLSDKQTELEHLQRYMSIAPLVKGKVILDAACGEGYGSNILSEYADQVYGFDISEEAIYRAREKYTQSSISFIQGSVEYLEVPDNSIDMVVSFETIEHVNEEIQIKFMREIQRVLKHDGVLIMSTPDKYWYSDLPKHHNPFHVKEFYKKEYCDFLESFFTHVEFYYQKLEISSLISNQKSADIKHLQSVDAIEQLEKGKYIVAVCGNQEIAHLKIDSITFSPEFKLQDYINRIIELQYEVEERNNHLQYLDGVISDRDNLIEDLTLKTEKIGSAEETIITLLEEVTVYKDKITSLLEDVRVSAEKVNSLTDDNNQLINELEKKENVLKTLHDELYLLQGEFQKKDDYIQQLEAKEAQLNAILNSRGWEGLSKYYRFRDTLVPSNSRRKIVVKVLASFVKKPRQTLKYLNWENLKKLKYYHSTDSTGMLQNRIDNYMERHDSQETTIIKIAPIQMQSEKKKLIFPEFQDPLVSIIIPVYNQWDYTYNCLSSILENKEDSKFEVIIADDLSTDETQNITEFVENITVVRDGVNRGFLLNCNNAATFAKGKYILFLNNDTSVQPGWLSSLTDLMERDEQIGIAGSKLVYPDGRLQEAGGIIWDDASGWNYGRLNNPDNSEFNYVKEVDYISGASIIVRRSFWDEVEGFDERYVPAYFEDSDLAFEARKRNYKVVLQPSSVVVHFEGISHGTDTGAGIKSYQIDNKEKFVEKWADVLSDQYSNAEHVFKARDRSKHKKTVLIIDHYVPHYDKDAGSRTVYQYIQYFIDNNMNVKFIGDNFFKHEPYTSVLQQMGVEVLYGSSYQRDIKNWIKANGQYFDFVFLNRPHISIKYIDWIKGYTDAKVIYYGHDLHYLREEREYELTGNATLLKQANNWKNIEFELFQKSDVVYYPSQIEVDKILEQFPTLHVKAIPAYIYDASSRLLNERNPMNTSDLLFVGGFAHKPNIDGVIWFISKVLPTILQSLPNVKINIVGSNPPDSIKELQSDHVIVHGFVSDEQLAELYLCSRLDIVPLRYGAGVKGKVVEALYHQIPIITTSVGAEGLPNIEGHLIVADDEVSFADEIVQAYNNEEYLKKLSEKSLKYIQKYFSAETVKDIIDEDFS